MSVASEINNKFENRAIMKYLYLKGLPAREIHNVCSSYATLEDWIAENIGQRCISETLGSSYEQVYHIVQSIWVCKKISAKWIKNSLTTVRASACWKLISVQSVPI